MNWNQVKNAQPDLIEQFLGKFKKKKELSLFLSSRDEAGNTLLLSAVSSNNFRLVEMLLERGANINQQDSESGYTPLHKATLKLPKLDHAISEDLHSLLEKVQNPSSSMTLWSWGSNNNYLLGHGDFDTRTYPEKLNLFKDKSNSEHLESILDYDLEIKQIQVSKYHVAILTKQHFFGTGGRLGHGSEETVFTPKIVQGIAGTVNHVAVGPDHTLAITSNGSVWVWGNNKYSQLGVSNSSENQLVPAELPMKKFNAKLAAASKYHSVVVTEGDSIYTWGTNNGQIGHSQPIQIHPRKITSFPIQPILQASCTDNATAFLLKTNAVYVIVNGEYLKVTFPIPEPSFFSRFDRTLKAIPVNLSANGNHFVSCLSNGELYIWDPQAKANISKNQIYPKKVVAVGKKNMNFKACAISVNSSLVVTTESGHVYIGEIVDKIAKYQENKINYKFKRIANLEHVIYVSASIGGSVFALRSDFRCPQKVVEDTSLKRDLIAGLDAERTDFDFYFYSKTKEQTKAHQIILRSRSKFFSRILSDASTSAVHLPENIIFCFNNRIPNLFLDDYSTMAINVLLEYLYTGSMTVFWQAEGNLYTYHKDERLSQLQGEIRRLQALFEIDETEFFRSSINSNSNPCFPVIDQANVSIRLKSNVFYCHSLFLSTRCEYFRMVLGYKSSWNLKIDSEGYPTVDLQHIELPVFLEIYSWMTKGVLPVSEEKPKPSDIGDWLYFVEKILVVANELLLPDIVSISSAILARFLTVNNVLHNLEISDIHCARNLKEVCLDFVVRNIETFFRLRLFKNCDLFVIKEIEKKLKQLQLAKLPSMLGPEGFYAKLALECKTAENRELKCKIPAVTAICTSLKSISLENSPAISSSTISPLLTPLNLPISTSYGSLSKSFDLGKSYLSANTGSQVGEWQTPKSKKIVSGSPMKNSFSENTLTKKSSSVKASPALKAEPKYPEITDTFYLDEELEQQEWKTLKSLEIEPKMMSPVASPWKPVPTITPVKQTTEKKNSWKDMVSISPVVSNAPKGATYGKTSSPFAVDSLLVAVPAIASPAILQPKLSQKERKKLKAKGGIFNEEPKCSSPVWSAIQSSVPSLLEIQGQDLKKKESVSSLKEIQLQQELDKINALREKTKPLARIQLEETAMEEIKKFYLKAAVGNTGEWVNIKRLPPY
ncbi:hypothetical protein HDV01_007219 [Terramyces sp. JEL0728]|nr:hypothetical protein HDV01_007219 [Terramyces sp. JEL0728]